MPEALRLRIIGRLRTPFADKFGVPRQARLVDLPGTLEMIPPFDQIGWFDGLEEISHVWITFLFHQAVEQGWKGRVRPPRLGGNRRLGVFATRSPFRPNHLGLSVLRLRRIEHESGRRVKLLLSGVDMVDGTPVVDIKPYIPYADAVANARGGFASDAPEPRLEVRFTTGAQARAEELAVPAEVLEAMARLLALDPRPAYAAGGDDGKEYGMSLYQWNFRWQVFDSRRLALVVAIEPFSPQRQERPTSGSDFSPT